MAYRKNSSKIWTGILAVLLVLVLAGTAALVGVLSDGFKNWDKFKPDEEQEQTEEQADNGGAVIGESVGNGVKLMAEKIPVAEYAAHGISPMAETAYTLTATITPENATNKKVDWSVEFVTPSSAWANGKTVTDYVTITPTADGALTANVECKAAFGEQIRATVVSRDNKEVSASVTIDYAQRLQDISVKFSAASGLEGDSDLTLTYEEFPQLKIYENASETNIKKTVIGYETSDVYTLAETYSTTVTMKFTEDFKTYFSDSVVDLVGYGFQFDLVNFETLFIDITDGIVPNYDIFTELFGKENDAALLYELFSGYDSELPVFIIEAESTGNYTDGGYDEYYLSLDLSTLGISVSDIVIEGGNIIF